MSPSTTISNVPVTGLLSLDVTFLRRARLIVPAGTMKSGRFPRSGGSRFGTAIGTGVPTNNGGGSFVLSGTSVCASAPEDTINIVNAIPCYLGYLWPLWDAKRQTFADKIMSTYVIKAVTPQPRVY